MSTTIPADAYQARLAGGERFLDCLRALFDAVRSGRHVADIKDVIVGKSGFCVLITDALAQLDGAEREGFLMTLSWWMAVAVEGDVLSPADLVVEMKGGLQ